MLKRERKRGRERGEEREGVINFRQKYKKKAFRPKIFLLKSDQGKEVLFRL